MIGRVGISAGNARRLIPLLIQGPWAGLAFFFKARVLTQSSALGHGQRDRQGLLRKAEADVVSFFQTGKLDCASSTRLLDLPHDYILSEEIFIGCLERRRWRDSEMKRPSATHEKTLTMTSSQVIKRKKTHPLFEFF